MCQCFSMLYFFGGYYFVDPQKNSLINLLVIVVVLLYFLLISVFVLHQGLQTDVACTANRKEEIR